MERNSKEWEEVHDHVMQAKEAVVALIGLPNTNPIGYILDVHNLLSRYNQDERSEELFSRMNSLSI